MKKFAFLLLLCFAFAFKILRSEPDQVVAENAKVTFAVSHVSGTVTGTLTGLQGNVVFVENNLAGSSMNVSLDANSVDTKNRARDSDLRDKKFFDVGTYPRVQFKSKEITKSGEGFQVRGDLTIKDQTHEVLIPFKVTKQENGRFFTGKFTLDRRDYNLGKSVFPPVGKTVDVTIEALVK